MSNPNLVRKVIDNPSGSAGESASSDIFSFSDKGRNYFINADMRIAQRGTSFISPGTGTYNLDRMIYNKVGTMTHTISQDTDVPTFNQANYLFQNSLRMNLTATDTSIAAGDFTQIGQPIEGYNFANLAGKVFTLSFWVKATLTGTYCVSFVNTGGDRSYVAEYTINSPSTWEYKTITVTASPFLGTWNYTIGVGLRVRWALACGSTFQTTAGSWQAGNFFATANQINGTNTGATDFRLTGIMINEGSTAAPFRPFSNGFSAEVVACQRYYEKSYDIATPPGTSTAAGMFTATWMSGNRPLTNIQFKVKKRAPPTMIVYSSATGATGKLRGEASGTDINAGFDLGTIGEHGFAPFQATGSATDSAGAYGHYTADAEL